MERLEEKTTRLIVWSLAGSILVSSCTCGNINIIDDFNDSDDRKIDDCCAIHIKMDEKQIDYLNELAILSQKIIENRSFAKKVCSLIKKIYSKECEFNTG